MVLAFGENVNVISVIHVLLIVYGATGFFIKKRYIDGLIIMNQIYIFIG